MTSEYKELIKKRGQIKSRITLFEKHLSSLLCDLESVTKLQIAELTLRLTKLQDLSNQFDETQLMLETLEEGEVEKQMLEREETENRLFSLMAKAQELIDNFNESNNKSSSSSQCNSGQSNIKLPPLKISSFNGDTNKWLEFHGMYLSLIHNNESIDNISKFQYLKSYVEGPALALISSVTVSSDNYLIAWSLLCDRYNNKRILINEHIKCLFTLEPLSKESDRGLRNLVDTITKNLSALNILGEPTSSWDTLIIHMASSKLDSITNRAWEDFRSNLDSPTLADFFDFIRQRATVLETVQASKAVKVEKQQVHPFTKSKSFVASSSGGSTQVQGQDKSQGQGYFQSQGQGQICCLYCKQNHKLYECLKFKALPVEERAAKVFEWKICNNCFRRGHSSYQCRLGGCRICRRKHNTMLHKQSSLPHAQPVQQVQQRQSLQQAESSGSTSLITTNNNSIQNDQTSSDEQIDNSRVISMSAVSSNPALLSTALVEVTNNDKKYTLRALLDSGSQSSFITEAARAKIGATSIKEQLKCISGLNNATLNITEHCKLKIKSLHNSFTAPVKCYVLPMITDRLPQMDIKVNELNIPTSIILADPTFYMSGEIDLLLGADIFWDIISSAKIKLGFNKPLLHETQLGWVVAGPMGGKYINSQQTYCNFSKDIQQQLTKFWELEDVPPSEKIESADDNFCEKHFNDTTYRDNDGRFCVTMPLRESSDVLGESYNIAEKRLFQMERKMRNNSSLRQEYNKFMHEYESLGHMTEISDSTSGYYLPHHAVIKESSTSTKVRAVFDASAVTSSGKSLNDIQHVGPVVQDDLFSILLRFRQHQYVVTGDIEKMYRQVALNPGQRHLQQILWRDSEDKPIKIFQLNTVTYGTASAPFLSTRCLLQLAKECTDDKVSESIKHDFYIDDYITGSHSEEELRHTLTSVTEILQSACFPLRKFRTNTPSIFKNFENFIDPKDLDLNSQAGTLGLQWDPADDVFKFPMNLDYSSKITKRSILSDSSKLFDPLGLLSLCTITPKIILQRLWMTKLDWDDPIPSEIEAVWRKFLLSLQNLTTISIPRYVLIKEPTSVELHSFCDASQDAYAVCVYLRSIDISGQVQVKLLCAKSKVAPVKTQTIPRLELCGAVLSARLVSKILQSLRLTISKQYYWTDSTVVLSWIGSQPGDLKSFVSNRVADVQRLTASGSWRHVPGIHNPADLASRGMDPRQMQGATVWWGGPQFLSESDSYWPEGIILPVGVPEKRAYNTKLKSKAKETYTTTTTCTTTTNTTTTKTNYKTIKLVNFDKHSDFTLLLRSTAYLLRFVHFSKDPVTGHLTTTELDRSLHTLVKQHQTECFKDEIQLLLNNKQLPGKSRLVSLNPFLDEEGILRVGGRIQSSAEPYNKKHPIILDSNHNFTKLLFAHEHIKLLHGGPNHLLTSLRQTYWPISGRILARTTVNNCRICRILKAQSINPVMGNLPTSRVTPNYPFQVSGVDFAGPFPIRDRRGRGCKFSKAYLCLFVCFSTKALHLEVASDLSTEVFILCLRRFASRRGKPTTIFCDNGTNFVGANNELARFLKTCNESISSFAANEGITFKFSPAYSPHFGGLWEAGVKSAKFHLIRMIGNNHMTFEELTTLFVQIEAILNSRPLTPLSSDPTDLYPLTPAHFLIGRPLTSLPSPALIDVQPNRLSHYQLIEQTRQHFWDRWRHEFLCELQQRSKWRINQGQIQVGDMVILKEANLPPLQWRLGRIQQLHPGQDGVARVADVLTTRGTVRRAIRNMCPLPMTRAEDSSTRNPTDFEGGEIVYDQTSTESVCNQPAA